ncbi:MAG: PASTA domain-containing protein [Synergistaceae bacterium]|nr:PASTA domain-containing protein [Synergistaceae bacterium]
MGKLVRLVLLFVVTVIFASGAIAVYTVFFRPEVESIVPALRERNLTEAVAEAERLGFVVQVESVASTLPKDRVLAQSPESGMKARKGQVIVLQVSSGGELHEVPDVKGQTLAQAQAAIKARGFAMGDVVKIREAGVQPGTVIAQSPAAPAKIASGRKIDLLLQDGGNSEGVVTIPDVNRMTESEARNVLEASGVKVQAVDRVYSPLLPEGLAIETRPGAGSTLRTGQGVILKLATQRRPAGYMDANSDNPNVRRVSSQNNNNQTQNQNQQTRAQTPTQAQNQNNNRQQRPVSVQVPGQDDVFIGDDYETPVANNNTRTQTRAQTQTQTPTQNNNQTPAPASTTAANNNAPAQTPAASSPGGNKTARIRYIVPPIGRPMDLRIELTDPSGTRNVMSRQVKGGESINTTASYSNECVVSIYLGGQSVWQERQR